MRLLAQTCHFKESNTVFKQLKANLNDFRGRQRQRQAAFDLKFLETLWSMDLYLQNWAIAYFMCKQKSQNDPKKCTASHS